MHQRSKESRNSFWTCIDSLEVTCRVVHRFLRSDNSRVETDCSVHTMFHSYHTSKTGDFLEVLVQVTHLAYCLVAEASPAKARGPYSN